MHVPLGIYDAIAIARFQLGCNVARTLVNLDAVLVVDEAHDVIARDSVATGWEDKLVDVLFGQNEWFLLVEVLAHHEEFLRFYDSRSLFLALVLAQEWDEVSPASCTLLWLLVLALQFIEVFIAQDEAMLSDTLEEGFVLLDIVILAEFIYYGVGHFHIVLLEPFGEDGLTLLLNFSGVAAQYRHNLAFRLGGAYEADPVGLHMLALGCKNLHLVATVKLVAQWYQLVVYLGSDAVAAQEGVYLEGEVERRRVGRHRLDFSLRGEHEDF